MSNYLRKIFSSISVKLFVCFWLIAFGSILTTHFISININQDSKRIELHKGDMRKLHNIQRKLENRVLTNTEQFFSRLPHRVNKNTILKRLSSNEILTPKNSKIKPDLISFLTKNSLGKLVTIKYKSNRITGPRLIKINQENYQMFIVAPDKNFVWGMYLKRLPTWLLILIPLIMSITLCWLLARSLTRPILDMKKVSTELGNGKLSMRVIKAAKRKDELGDLAYSFNLMAEKLEQNLSAHQRLLADVSHELRSPLTRMQIALGLIQKSPDDSERRDKHLTRVETEIQRLDSMIADVLALSKLENTMPTLKLEALNFTALLHQTVQDSQYLANEKQINIQLEGPQELPLLLDRQLIMSALSNIINNSIKYSPTDRIISVQCTLAKNEVVISIADQGDGVPEDKLQNLFKPFYRVSDARDRKSGGTGLGLAIAQQAITAHNGKINAQNNEQGGLTVKIYLPLSSQGK